MHCPTPGTAVSWVVPRAGGGEPPYTLTFGTETREDTVQFRRRTSVLGQYWLVCDQSSTSSENGLDPCRGAIGESPTSSHRKFIVSGQGGGFAVPPPAGRGRAPSPVHCPGEPGDTPRSPPTLRWVGTITRTDMGVQQNLHLADSQPGTQCTHGCVHANGGLPAPRTRGYL